MVIRGSDSSAALELKGIVLPCQDTTKDVYEEGNKTNLSWHRAGTPPPRRRRSRPRRRPPWCPAKPHKRCPREDVPLRADVHACLLMSVGGGKAKRAACRLNFAAMPMRCKKAFAHREAGLRADELHEALRQVASGWDGDQLAVDGEDDGPAPHRRVAHCRPRRHPIVPRPWDCAGVAMARCRSGYASQDMR